MQLSLCDAGAMRPHAAPLCGFDSNIVGCWLGLVLAWQTYLPTAPRRTALAGWFGCLAWLFAFGLAWLGLAWLGFVLAWLTRLPYRTTPHGSSWLPWLLGLAGLAWLGLVLAWLTRLPYRTTPHGSSWLVWLLGLALRLWLGPALAWLGLAWLGLAWLGLAWLGSAWLGLAWLSLAWLGLAWLGLVLAWLTCLPYRTTPHGSSWLAWLLGLALRLWLGPAFF